MFPELSTNRFLLQEIITDDQSFIFEGLSHPQVIPYYGVSYKSLEETQAQMIFYKEMQEQQTGIWWKIVNKENSNRVGAIGFNNFQQQHRRAELGYWLLPTYWGGGIIAEVLPAVITYMFNERGIHRIEALVEAGNENSNKVLERARFQYEGQMRDCERKNGVFISLSIYSLLSTDTLK